MSASLHGGPDWHAALHVLPERLIRDFVGVPPPLVKEVVQRWVRSFEGACVTVHLPIMIERASRDELSHLAAQPALGDGPG